MLHDEADGISGFATAKTLIQFFGWGDCEGRGLFVMKRAKANVVSSPFFQFYKPADYVNNIEAAKNLLYGTWGNHLRGGQVIEITPQLGRKNTPGGKNFMDCPVNYFL